MSPGRAPLVLSNAPMTLRGYFRTSFIAMSERVKAQRVAHAERRRAAVLAAAERDATRLFWRD